MPMRSVWIRSALLVAGWFAVADPAAAQGSSRREQALARRWATVREDSAAVDSLFQATVHMGGPVLFRAALSAAGDPGRPSLVRIYALAALQVYAFPRTHDHAGDFLRAARDAEVMCEPSLAWVPGDTLRACGRSAIRVGRTGGADPPAALSADSARKDSIVVVSRGIVRGGRSAVAGAADLLLWHLTAAPPPPRRAPTCPERPRVAPVPGAGSGGDRVYGSWEVDQPPELANACDVARQMGRNYPPLLRDLGEEGTLVLSLVVDAHGLVRDIAVEHAPSRPEFAHAALRVVERMRFTPARAGGAPVAVRISLPIRFALALGYPRVSDP